VVEYKKPDRLSENIEDRRGKRPQRDAARRNTQAREAPAKKSGRGEVVSRATRRTEPKPTIVSEKKKTRLVQSERGY